MEKLQPGYYALCPMPMIEYVCSLADEYGVRAKDRIGQPPSDDSIGVWVCDSEERGRINELVGRPTPGMKRLTPAQFLSMMEEDIGYKFGATLRIGEWEVDFKDGGIQVGCTFVSKEIVEKVYNKLKNK